MKCGIRFCGGCNCGYDRKKVYNQIIHEFPNIDFSIAAEDDTYDFLLILGGCSSCCASYEQFDVKGEVLKMWSDSQVDHITKSIKKILDN